MSASHKITKDDITPKREALFWAKVQKSDGCWNWTASKGHKGYGTFQIGHVPVRAARLSFFLANGYWPEPLCCHRCDNPSCVRPDHLFAGTSSDNAVDMVKKGRKFTMPGEAYPNAKLTEMDILTIRSRCDAGESSKTIAQDFGVHRATIRKIHNRQKWRHVA